MAPVATIEPDLAEWDYGDYEDCVPRTFARDDRTGVSSGWVSDRADRLIARLRALDGTVALFSHGHFGCVLAVRWIGLPVIDGQHFLLGTASLSILDAEPSHPEVPVNAVWNSVASRR